LKSLICLLTDCVKGADEQYGDWVTRRWIKYAEYGRAIDDHGKSDVKLLVAATDAGLFGFVYAIDLLVIIII